MKAIKNESKEQDSKEMYARCLTNEYCDFTKGNIYEILDIDNKEEYYKFSNDKGETQWLRFAQCELVNVLNDSTVKNKPSNCTREHCVIENDTCEGYMGVDFCTLKEDNNPSPLEAIDKIEIRIGSMSLQLGKEFKIIEQALTNYANMVEMLEGLRGKYDGIHKSFGYPRYATVNPSEIVADITKVLEGKI
jgi:hypothetical protein